MRIARLEANNFKKLKAVEVDFEGKNMVQISGKNKQGKSTILDAIWSALGGARELPEDPIRHGESRAQIRLELDDMLVERVITENDTKLKVTNLKGEDLKSPQTLLNNLISEIGLRPRKFANADKSEQVDMLLDVVDLDFDITELEWIVDDMEIKEKDNPLETIDTVYDDIYQERRDINRDLKKEENTLKSYADVKKKEKVDINQLIDERDKLQKENQEIENLQRHRKEKKKEIASLDDEIKELEEKLRLKKEEKSKKEQSLEDLDDSLDNKLEVKEENNNRIEQLNEKIKNASEINEQARKYKEKKEIKDRVDKLNEESNSYSNMLDSIKDYKERLIKEAEFPVDGLSFNNGEVYYNQAPFDQASRTEKLEVGFAILKALNPDLKVILIEDGNTIDEENLQVLERLAEDENYLIIMEYMDESGEVGLVIEDGEIVKNNYGSKEDNPFAEVS